MKEKKSNPMLRIWQIAEPEHGKLLLSVVSAVLGVISGGGMCDYWIVPDRVKDPR